MVETPPSCRNTRGRCRVGRNAPVSRFDARGALGSGRKCDGDLPPFRLWRPVRTGFSRSSKFRNNERPKTRPRLRSFPVLGISGPDPVQVRSRSGPVSVFLQSQDWTYKHYLTPLRISRSMSCSGLTNCSPSIARTVKSSGRRSTMLELSSVPVPWSALRESASGLPIDFPGL